MDKDILRSRIIEQRKKRAWSQVEFAKRMNVGRSTVAMWETGDRVPDTPTIHRLAEIFDISADYLLGLSDNPSPVIKNVDDKDGLAFIDGETPLTEEEKEYLKESLELFRRMKAKREQQKP